MLGFNDSDVSSSKFFVSNGSLPAYIDPHQPPSAKKPFSTILNQPFTHTVSDYPWHTAVTYSFLIP